jgi:hypothetical protein
MENRKFVTADDADQNRFFIYIKHQTSNIKRGYFAMQTFFGSVKKFNASRAPSRRTPLAFMPTLLRE